MSTVLNQAQVLTILFELETVKAEWPRIMLEQDEGHESFEEAMERFCVAAQSGKIVGEYYFNEGCACFYGSLLPKAKYDPNNQFLENILDSAATEIAKKISSKIREQLSTDRQIIFSRTYIERLLDDSYNIQEGVSIFTESEESGDNVEFLRELYCLCYPYCSEEWRAANPLSWALNHLTEELGALTEGQVPAIHCGY